MNELINEMSLFKNVLCKKENLQTIINYYNNQFYVYILLKQYDRLCSNIKSINALLNIDNIEDAYTIFRKYLETFAIIFSVYENKSIVDKYLVHDSFIGYKACGKKEKEIKTFISNKPIGFLEYGYLENIVNESSSNFKYTMKTVCKAAKISNYYQWYKLCNNFVHNNLSSVKINPLEGKNKLIEKCYQSFNYFKTKLNQILKLN